MSHILLALEALLFLASAWCLGEALLKALRPSFSPLRRFLVAMLLGLGLWSFIGAALGAAGLFDATVLQFILIAALAGSWRTLRAAAVELWQQRAFGGLFQRHPAFKAMLLLWFLVGFVIVFMPVTGFDAKRYHVPIVHDLIENERFAFSEDIVNYAYLPLGAEALYAVPTALFGNLSAPYLFQLLQFAVFWVLLLFVYDFVRDKVRVPWLAFLAPLLLLSLMDLEREVYHGGYIDVIMFTFAVTSFLVLLDHAARGGGLRSPAVAVSAILLGTALSMKYLAIPFAAFNGTLLLLFLWRERTAWRRAAVLLAVYVGIVLLVAGFWYGKNFIAFGNPVYPMFHV